MVKLSKQRMRFQIDDQAIVNQFGFFFANLNVGNKWMADS
jgi:hypothetical protein